METTTFSTLNDAISQAVELDANNNTGTFFQPERKKHQYILQPIQIANNIGETFCIGDIAYYKNTAFVIESVKWTTTINNHGKEKEQIIIALKNTQDNTILYIDTKNFADKYSHHKRTPIQQVFTSETILNTLSLSIIILALILTPMPANHSYLILYAYIAYAIFYTISTQRASTVYNYQKFRRKHSDIYFIYRAIHATEHMAKVKAQHDKQAEIKIASKYGFTNEP